jgi:hypothetical protein
VPEEQAALHWVGACVVSRGHFSEVARRRSRLREGGRRGVLLTHQPVFCRGEGARKREKGVMLTHQPVFCRGGGKEEGEGVLS